MVLWLRKDRCLYETLVFVFASSRPGGLQTISVKNSFAFVWVYDFVWVGWAMPVGISLVIQLATMGTE